MPSAVSPAVVTVRGVADEVNWRMLDTRLRCGTTTALGSPAKGSNKVQSVIF